ncbi:hypothetical protein MEQU1_003384 [Malassezia equina]|uniref:Chromo domain-containing protein n=1 Tax=Malassezia equina TaxID=1381935 RepID=A0AAF0J074_9BASI|nr:hypothetical protein MEQU1_003384 [Malassezia equina]
MFQHTPAQVDDWEEATVKEILAHRYNANTDRLEYLIQWHDNDATWEPEQNSVEAEQLVFEYWTLRQGVEAGTAVDYVRSLHGQPEPPRMPCATDLVQRVHGATSQDARVATAPAPPDATSRNDTASTTHVSGTSAQAQVPEPALQEARASELPSRRSTRRATSSQAEDAPRGAPVPKAEPAVPDEPPYTSVLPDMSEREMEERRKYDALNDWDALEVRVETVRRVDTGLEAFLRFQEGHRLSYPTEVANRRCPQAMISFYESRVRFIARHPKQDTPAGQAAAART